MQTIDISSPEGTGVEFKNISTELEEANHTFLSVDDVLYDLPFSVILLWSFCYGVISLTAIVANFFVLYIIATNPRMRTVANYLIANMAVADIIIGIFSIPFQFQAAFLQYWMLPYFMCPLCPFVQILSVNVSIITLTAVILDRCQAITHPLKPRISKRGIKIVLSFIWIFSAVASAPHIFALRVTLVFDDLTQNKSKPMCLNVQVPPTAWELYNVTLCFIEYFGPLSMIIIAHIKMCKKLQNREFVQIIRRAVNPELLESTKKAIKMMFVLSTLFGISWLPLQVYTVLQAIMPDINNYKYINVIWLAFHWLSMMNCAYNPFIYAMYCTKFKSELKNKFVPCCVSCRRQPAEEIEMDISPKCGRLAAYAIRQHRTQDNFEFL